MLYSYNVSLLVGNGDQCFKFLNPKVLIGKGFKFAAANIGKHW